MGELVAVHGGRPRRADARRNYDERSSRRRSSSRRRARTRHSTRSRGGPASRAERCTGTSPTRLDLVEVVLAEQIAELVELGRGLLTAEDALAGLTSWLRAAILHGLTYRVCRPRC